MAGGERSDRAEQLDRAAAALVAAWIEAFNNREPDALVELCDPEINHQPSVLAGRGSVYYGHDGIREWFADVAATGIGHTARVRRTRRSQSGDLLVFGDLLVGDDPVTPFSLWMRLREGKVIATRSFLSDEQLADALARLDSTTRR
jgi:ketosteroid isomerase-like protein